MTAYEVVLDALRANGSHVIERGQDKAQAQCPAHDDRNPSLSVYPRKDRKGTTLKCHAGCELPVVLAAVGLSFRDLYDDTGMRDAYRPNTDYSYPNGDRKRRRTGPDGVKHMSWAKRGANGGRALYLADKIPPDCPQIYLVESEKAAQAIWAMGAVAVATGGAKRTCDMAPLCGADVIAVVDRDTAGLAWAAQRKNALAGVAATLRFVRCAVDIPKADVVEHLDNDLSLVELEQFDPFVTAYGDGPAATVDDDVPGPAEPPPDIDDHHAGQYSPHSYPGPADDTPPEPPDTEGNKKLWAFIDGAAFVLDIPADIPAVWGHGSNVVWAEGESLMIAGPMGLGKTTLWGLLIRAQLGVGDGAVLGLPVTECAGKILVLAMDRPAQIARSLRRQFTEADRGVLAERVMVWRGPPPADVAKQPALLTWLAEAADAHTVYLDSIKDAAIGLSEDEVGAGYNRARQRLLATGRQLAEAHHTTKRAPGGGPPTSVADIYGSAWITNGTGSIILLSGDPGDPIVGFRHVRAPADQIGPFQLLHDPDSGEVSVFDATDLVELARLKMPAGLTTRDAAVALFDAHSPTTAQVEKARRKLAKLTTAGELVCQEGDRAKQVPSRWFPAGAVV